MEYAEEVSSMKAKVLDCGATSSQKPPVDPGILDIVVQNDANKFPEDDKLWLKSIINNGINQGLDKTVRALKIQKVPRTFRGIEANKNCFDPLVVSIGPYHHGKTELEFMEKHKSKMASLYVENNMEKLEEMYKKVVNVATTARECYTEEYPIENFNNKEFARMMFLDGCFLLQFIYCCTNNKREDLLMKCNIAASVQRDLLLLENQLPFQILNELISSRFNEDEWQKMLSNFIAQIRGPPLKASFKEKIKSCIIGKRKAKVPDKLMLNEDEPAHLLEIIRRQLIGESRFTDPPRSGTDWSSYRSAKELDAVGIHFRPSKTRQLTDVKFKSLFFAAILDIPPITIDDCTKSMLLNMVAYEACPDSPADFGISSYICFMDSVIDHAEDVKVLRSKSILLNILGSDQQVADLFNQISDNLVPNPYAYAAVKDRIEKHYKNKIKIWLAEWLHAHFSSPWTVLAFVGAVLALALSVMQAFPSLTSKKN